MSHKLSLKWNAYILIFLSIFSFNHAAEAGKGPKLNEGKKWRIGYYEGGPNSEYTDTMRTFVKGLVESGWISDLTPPDIIQDTPKPYWEWLSQCNSPFLLFKKEDSYSANWERKLRIEIREKLLVKLKNGQLDLVIAMGTWAGQDLVNNEHSVPTMVLSTSNPIEAGIVKSADNSGFDHVTARLDSNRYLRQLRMFHRIVGFQKLGIAFENSSDGKIYSAINDVQQVAKERGFKIVSCNVIDATSDADLADRSCLDCYRRLVQKVDAVYVTPLNCVDRPPKEIAEIFKTAGIPSFSMVGSKFVRMGIMLSISSDSGYTELGRYNAWKFGEILNGTRPVMLKQVFEDPLDIAVNLKTAKSIGFDMPDSIIRIATEIYDQ